jgi:hypothetical protein
VKKLYLILGSGVVVSAVGMSVFVMQSKNKEAPSAVKESSDVLASSVYKDETYGVSITYPTESKVIQLSEQDRKDKFIFRFQQSKSPEYTFNVRAETGLRLPSQLARLDTIDLVVDGASRALPGRYPEYKLLKQEDLEIAGKSAASIEFSYVGPAKELIHQRLVLVAKDADTALYFTMQSRDADYEELSTKVFDEVIKTVKL